MERKSYMNLEKQIGVRIIGSIATIAIGIIFTSLFSLPISAAGHAQLERGR